MYTLNFKARILALVLKTKLAKFLKMFAFAYELAPFGSLWGFYLTFSFSFRVFFLFLFFFSYLHILKAGMFCTLAVRAGRVPGGTIVLS